MVRLVCFITPSSLIKVGSKAIEWVPIAGPAFKYTKKMEKFTGIADPVTAGSRGIGIIFNHCFGKLGALSLECVIWVSFSIAGGLFANPTLIATGAEFGNILLDEIFDD